MYRLISVTFPHFDIYVRSLFCFPCHYEIPCGLAVRIPGFHPGDPGSTPGMGTLLLSVETSQVFSLFFIKL